MCSDKLTLNNGKTEFIIIETRPQLSKVNIDHIRVGDCDIKPTTSVRNLGAWFDEKFTTATRITKICRAAFYHLHSIRRIRTCPPPPSNAAQALIGFDSLIYYKQDRLLQQLIIRSACIPAR